MKSKQIKEINQHISDALKQWSEIAITADADGWGYHLEYNNADLLNAVFILNHIVGNIGIKSRHIDESNAERFGSGFRKLLIETAGLDPWNLVNEKTENNDR